MENDVQPGNGALLTDDQRRDLEGKGTVVFYPPGDAIFREGQPSRSAVVIKEGHVRITQHAPDGAEIFLATRGPGEILGDEGALTGKVRSATVTTITEVTGVDVGANELRQFVEAEGLWPVVYEAAVHRRRESDQRTLIARLDVRQRLINLLVDQAHRVGVSDGDDLIIEAAFTQQEIADTIGASREAVAVELRRLREEDLVTTGRRRFVLHDLDALHRISPG